MLIALLAAGALALPPATHPVVAEAIELTREHFFDAQLVQEQWADVLAQPHVAAQSPSQVINDLLDRLETSHTTHYTPDQQAFFELLDIYAPAGIDEQVAAMFPQGVSYIGIGVFTHEIDGQVFITDIWPGGPAHHSGLRVGDEIVAVNDKPFQPIHSFADHANEPVMLTIRRHRDGPTRDLPVTPVRIQPGDAFEQALVHSAQVRTMGEARLGYIRPISYAGQRFHDALVDQLRNEPLRDADGLVLDLRGGWGGASPDFAELFLGGAPDMTFTTRDGTHIPISTRWRKPLVVLIDERTRSGKEVLAWAFKQAGIELVGTTTAGAVVGGRPFLLRDASLLVIAVADVLVDGQRLEGRGVEPTMHVPFDRRYADGADPQLEAALKQLHLLINP